MKKLIFIVTLLVTSISSAKCLDRDLVASVTKPFKIVRQNWRLPPKPKDICDSNDAFYKLAEALIFIAKIQDEAGGSKTKSQSVVAQEGPFKFFKKRIKTIILEDYPVSGGCLSDTTVAYVNSSEDRVTHICSEPFKKYDVLASSAALIHESRHVEGYDHATCNHGYFAGTDSKACDNDFPSQGSYGIGVSYKILVMNLTKDPAIKQNARSAVVVDLLERFNTLPWDLKAGILAASSDNSMLSFFDGEKILEMKNLPLGQVLTSRYGIATFYSRDGQVKSYAYASKLEDAEGTMAEEYRTKSTPAERKELLDVYYGSDDYLCRLYSHTLKCDMTDEGGKTHVMNVSVSAIRPYAILEVPNSNSQVRKRYLVDEDGDHYRLPSTTAEMASFTERNLVKVSSGLTNALGFVRALDGKSYIINRSHQLMSVKGSQWALEPQYKGRKIQKIIPFVWSQMMEAM